MAGIAALRACLLALTVLAGARAQNLYDGPDEGAASLGAFPDGGPSSGGYIIWLKDPAAASPLGPTAAAFADAHPRARAQSETAGGGGSLSAQSADGAFLPSSPSVVASAMAARFQEIRDGQDSVLAAAGIDPSATTAQAGGLSALSAGGPSSPPQGPAVAQRFSVIANGMHVVGLSSDQVAALRASRAVKAVTPNLYATTLTVTTPSFLGLDGAGGVWDKQFGGPAAAGSNVLIAVIDTGTNSKAASFNATGGNAGAQDGLDSDACSEQGSCTSGKLVACRYFQSSFLAAVQTDARYESVGTDLNTCQDFDGHGTHTASTAGGDIGSAAISGGTVLSPGGMSGMAPGAAVAMYKALWQVRSRGVVNGTAFATGTQADIIGAVEKAVLDGADIISFSLGFGSPPGASKDEPMFEPFLNAVSNNVLVVAAVGNSGAAPSTVANSLPWVLGVAAGSHSRKLVATATVNAVGYDGVSSSTVAVGPATLTYAGDSDASGSLCLGGSLSSALVNNTVVICKRGQNDRVAKSAEVLRAGGIGMILANVAEGLTNLEADTHSVPTIHLNTTAGAAVLAAWAAAPSSSTASLSARRIDTQEAPDVASFSSRGPAVADGGAFLKPDILAPGVSVFAAIPDNMATATNNTGRSLSGTSMATPHIAGIAALLRAKYPMWSASAIKSALMTTASQVTNKGNKIAGTPFDYGAGHVDPARAFDPGMVYDANATHYTRYICATSRKPKPAYCKAACKPARWCTSPQGLRDLNLPSFAFPAIKCSGKRVTARRALTLVGAASTFAPKVTMPAGLTGTVRVDRSGKIKAQRSTKALQFSVTGEVRTFTLTVATNRVAAKGWNFGDLTWTDDGGKYSVRSPIAIECI